MTTTAAGEPDDAELTPSAKRRRLPRTFQTGHQCIIGWIGVVVVLAMAVIINVSGHRGADSRVIGILSIPLAIGIARFALCRVIASADGVRVVNMSGTMHLRWDEIERFEVVPNGPCPIRLRDSRTLHMTGIQQKNISAMLATHDTPERRMIDELNALLHDRSQPIGPRVV